MCLRQRCFLIFLAVCIVTATEAQVTQADNTTSPPIPGAGHDYIHLLSETVNPANGAVSLRIQLPTVKGRGISLPFSIAYDSNAALHVIGGDYPSFGSATWSDNTGYLAQGGWSYSLPTAGSAGWDVTTGTYPNFYTCGTSSDYMFSDPSGGQHSLYLGTQVSANGPCPDAGRVSLTGGDGQVAAQLATGHLQVSTADGTVFYFKSGITHPANSILVSLPTTIEDRNGNVLNVQDNGSNGNFVVTDTAGRTAISSSGFGPTGTTNTISVGGMNYQIAWKQSSKNFPTQSQWAGPAGEPNNADQCSPIASGSGNQTVASSITLPNAKQYKFYYGADNPDPTYNNPYGLLSEIDYPDGGWVKYTWKLSDTMNELADYPGVIPWSGPDCSSDPQVVCYKPVQDGCTYIYQTPVVATRQVGFGGSSTPSLIHTFTYHTAWTGLGTRPAWTQKTTNLTTTDNVLNQSFLTAYTYQSTSVPSNNVFANTTISPQIPVEQQIKYYDFNSSPMRTVNKTWANLYDLASEQTILENNLSSQTVYSYTSTAPFQLKETDEYDFGATTPSRITVNAYQSFSGTPGVIADKACSVITCSSGSSCTSTSANRVSETDYFYDGVTAACGSTPAPSVADVSNLVAGTHDETNFAAASTVPRGNLTKRTQWLSTGTGPSTTYTYDKTGQVLSVTDPCGNGPCSDVTGASHTTTYSYADSYSSGTPPGNTNAYVTKITDPLGNFATFKYAYGDGQLTSSTDPNLRVTSYKYNTPPTGCSFTDGLDRLSEIDSPDGGKTTYCYNDALFNASTPSPSVTTTKTITSSLNLVSVSASDGIGHPVKTILSSDPEGADTTDTTYDGLGRIRTQSNPHRAAPAPTDGKTTTTHDALGRVTSILQADGSATTTNYIGNCTTVTDEVGKMRLACSDAFGRLTQVEEPGAGATSGAAGTGTITIAGTEQSRSGTPGSGTASLSNNGLGCIYNGFGGYYPTTGTVSITVQGPVGVTGTANFGGTCDNQGFFTMSGTLDQMAATLATRLSGSDVTATSSGSMIHIIANANGSATNYAVSSSYTTNGSGYVSPAVPATLTGGNNTPVNDSGNVSATVDGFTATATYGAGATAQQIASSLASSFTASPVRASVNGAVITLTATAPGSNSNYSLSTSIAWNTSDFTHSSFTAAPSGATLTGGTDGSLGNTPLVTQYAYDALNNLTCAVQKASDTTAFTTCASASATWRPRSFLYDSLSRLTSATNPESGTIAYTYDANSNLSTKVSPRPNQTSSTVKETISYTYDALNRLTSKSYAGIVVPKVTYWYDGAAASGCTTVPPGILNPPANMIGHRTAMCDGSGATSWSYDNVGRTLAEARTIANAGTPVSATTINSYNFDGSIATIRYPSNTTILNYTTNGAGRQTAVQDSTFGISYAGSALYAPFGGLTSMTNGSAPITTTDAYSERLQPITLSAATQANTIISLSYDFHRANGDNGNIYQIVNNLDNNRTQNFTYDAYNRIASAYTQGNAPLATSWGETYTIDSWGNLTNRAGIAGKQNTEGLSVLVLVSNQLGSGFTYDAAGNMTANGSVTYTYDPENRLAGTAGISYTYDGDGNRVRKSGGTLYWGALGETNLSGSAGSWKEYVFFNGQRVARRDASNGSVHYFFANHLGSTSVATNSTGTTLEENLDYYPYGGVASGTSSDHYMFNGKERDAESGLDNFGARYDASSLGRFMTPDWAARPTTVPYAVFGDPQSLNLYGYVRNDPVSRADLDGHISEEAQCPDPHGCHPTDDGARHSPPNKQKPKQPPPQKKSKPEPKAKPPDDAKNLRLFPIEVSRGNFSITYRLRTADGKSRPNGNWAVFEHQTQSGFGRFQAGPNDYVSPRDASNVTPNSFGDDVGGGGLNTVQSFTISLHTTFDPADQTPVIIRYGNGEDHGSQGIWQPSVTDPVLINSMSQLPEASPGWVSGEF